MIIIYGNNEHHAFSRNNWRTKGFFFFLNTMECLHHARARISYDSYSSSAPMMNLHAREFFSTHLDLQSNNQQQQKTLFFPRWLSKRIAAAGWHTTCIFNVRHKVSHRDTTSGKDVSKWCAIKCHRAIARITFRKSEEKSQMCQTRKSKQKITLCAMSVQCFYATSSFIHHTVFMRKHTHTRHHTPHT